MTPAQTSSQRRLFDVHGYRFALTGDCQSAIEGIANNYAAYGAEAAEAEVIIVVNQGKPDYSGLPALRGRGYTPRFVSYRDGPISYYDYGGKALAIRQRETGEFSIRGTNPSQLYDACHDYLRSRILDRLDEGGMHRVQAASVSVDGRAALVLLPTGRSEKSLIDELLSRPGVRLLSDDSPLIDAKGRVFPFPVRLNVPAGAGQAIPEEHLIKIERPGLEPTRLVRYEYHDGRRGKVSEPGCVFIARHWLSDECRVSPASTAAGIRAMLQKCVIGKDLYKGLDFILSTGLGEKLAAIPVAASRLSASLALLKGSETLEVEFGRSTAANADAILRHARGRV